MSSDEDPGAGITRRAWLKGALVVGTASLAGPGGYATLETLVGANRPPAVKETFLYVNPEGANRPVWLVERGLVGKEARLRHFSVGDGANVLWRWHLDPDRNVGGGASALLMRVNEDELEFPEEYAMEEFVVGGLYAVFNCCTHACCRAGWQLIPRTSYGHDMGYDTIFCPCHCAQFHPTQIAVFSHPGPPEGNGARYIGVRNVAGPANRGMPLIPIRVEEDVIHGDTTYPEWYRYLDNADGHIL